MYNFYWLTTNASSYLELMKVALLHVFKGTGNPNLMKSLVFYCTQHKHSVIKVTIKDEKVL